jgi:Cu(I)/Ag(I) efflux system membrane fusion protein
MPNKLLLFLTGLILGAGLMMTACSKKTDQGMTQNGMTEHKTLYHCAMHPQIVSEKPGECPICHMRLTPVLNGGSAPMAAGDRKPLFYRNPMDASVTSPVPMKDGMGMDYTPVYATPQQAGMSIPGQASVHLDPNIQQQIGVSVATVARKDFVVSIRAAARVAYDPQLYNATIEHKEAAAFLRRARAQGSPDLLDQAESTVQSSELRLRQMGLSDEQIADIEKPGYDASGLLLGNKNGSAWVYANVYDYEANLIRPGQDVTLTSPSTPGETYHGTVRGIDPILNSDTRTLRVRIMVPRAGRNLRPETYLIATINASLGSRLSVPENAVMDTGTRQLVYVEKDSGTYEPREVQVGHRSEGYYEISSGLQEGEKVVASANFLIDSESRIQAATLKATQQNAQ